MRHVSPSRGRAGSASGLDRRPAACLLVALAVQERDQAEDLLHVLVSPRERGQVDHRLHPLPGDRLGPGEFAQPGDWIVEGRRGERWPVPDDQFRRSYTRSTGAEAPRPASYL